MREAELQGGGGGQEGGYSTVLPYSRVVDGWAAAALAVNLAVALARAGGCKAVSEGQAGRGRLLYCVRKRDWHVAVRVAIVVADLGAFKLVHRLSRAGTSATTLRSPVLDDSGLVSGEEKFHVVDKPESGGLQGGVELGGGGCTAGW